MAATRQLRQRKSIPHCLHIHDFNMMAMVQGQMTL